MSLKDMKDELKALRKEKSTVKPVSKMKKTEIALELEKLRSVREETPAVVATKALNTKKMEPKIADVKVAKEHEYPVAPASSMPKKKAGGKKETVVGGSGAVGVETKMSKRDILKKLIEEMSDSE
jgi:hypothetical protein